MTSPEVNGDLGRFVKDLSGARVDLSSPDLTVYLDIQARGILLYSRRHRPTAACLWGPAAAWP